MTRVELSAAPPERGTGCPECDSGNTPHTLAHDGKP